MNDDRFGSAEPAATDGIASGPPRYEPSVSGETLGPPASGSDGYGLAVASIVAGIANFLVLFGFGAVLALVLGFVAKRRIDRLGTQRGRSQAVAGIVLGWVGIAFDIGLVLLLVRSA